MGNRKAPLDQGLDSRVRPALAVLVAAILATVPAIPAAQEGGDEPPSAADPAPEAATPPEAAPAAEPAPAPAAPVPPSGAGVADLGITYGVANPPTPEEEAMLASIEEDFKAYKETAEEFKKVIDHIIKVEYEKRKINIEREFAEQISEEERLEDEARLSAIEYFEAFIAKYPENPTYTPDAMFRLSELYYEQSYVDYDDAMDVYNQQNDLFKAGKLPEKPIEPDRDYSKTIGLYTTLITKFPDYKNMDGVYYLLGYCFNEMGEFDAALYAWLGLVCSNLEPYEAGKGLSKEGGAEEEGGDHPSSTAGTVDSKGKTVAGEMFTAPPSDRYAGCKPVAEGTRFLTETWLRIGEYHFDFDYTPTGLQNAISAYRMATTDDTSTYYDLALYKLAWSFWRNGNYPEAIDEFVAVVNYSDKKVAETGKGGSELRPESVQYIALSFWENDWNGDNVDDPEIGLQKLKNPSYIDQKLPWLSEVYLQLGQTYMDDNQNQKAIEVYKSYLDHAEWANALEAPEVVQKIIQAYDAEKDEESKIAMIAELSKYGPDSDWAKENVDHPQTVLQVADAAEQALVATALKHHETAQNYKATGQAKTKPAEQAEWIAAAKEQYSLAAESYRKYLSLYPNSPQAYEMTYNLAEALFWSDNYTDAAKSYLEVRDSLQDNTYQKDAAYMLVKTLEMLQQTDKTLVVRSEPPEVVEGAGGKAVPEIDVPKVLADLIDAQAAYLKLFPEDKEQAPVFAYLAAKTNFDYGHWADASEQFQEIYDLYCKSDIIALYSWQNMAFIAGALDDKAESERLAVLQQDKKCAPSNLTEADLQGEAGTLIGQITKDSVAVIEGIEAEKIMATYAKAEETGDPALYEEAAAGLLKLYEKNPKGDEADGILWNAALSYEKCNKPLSALGVAEKLVSEHPESTFMGDALFKLAYNAFNSFEYEKSLQNFKLIADEARFKDSPHREAAVQNTALILENQQKYPVAADYWKKYAAMTKDKALALEASWKAAECWVKAKKWETVEKEMGAFASQFASNKDAQYKVVHARWYVALSFRERKKQGDYEKALPAIIEAFKKIKPSDAMTDQDKIDFGKAAEYASEAKFTLIEKKLPEFEKYKLNVEASPEKLSAVLTKDLPGMRGDLEKQYAEVLGFASPEWIVAAQFRIGYLWEIHSKILLNAPIPKAIQKLPEDIRADAEQQYMDKINSLVFPIEDGAKAEYAKALALAKGAGVMNTWTEQTLERLNAYDPDNYPLYKKGKVGTLDLQHSLPGLDMTVPGATAEGQP